MCIGFRRNFIIDLPARVCGTLRNVSVHQRIFSGPLVLALLVQGLAGCAHRSTDPERSGTPKLLERATEALEAVAEKFAPDPHLAIFTVEARVRGNDLVLVGEVDRPEAQVAAVEAVRKTGMKAKDEIELLPKSDAAEKPWAIINLSAANGREQPDHKAEMGTQGLMGHSVRVWKVTRHWLLVQTSDGYHSWIESGSAVRCSKAELDAWTQSKLLLVTAYEERVCEQPNFEAQPISDVVMGNLVKLVGEEGDWFGVELPDGRTGFLPKRAATEFREWHDSLHATGDNLERTGRMFLGRPYLWGGNSPKGMDCSGFCKLVFFLNGIELNRNASEQALEGVPVALDRNLSQLKKGDLLFFGWNGERGGGRWVTHVAIYLGDQRFIQSSQRVKISSLDPASPDYDGFHARSLLFARRILKE